VNYLALRIPGNQEISPPNKIPRGGLDLVLEIFRNGYTILLLITVVLSLIFIILGAISWITSEGDKQKLDSARKKITWAVGGLIVAFLSFAIVATLGYLFDVELLNFG
jgi:membrane protease YdiL (CAAX protease family)